MLKKTDVFLRDALIEKGLSTKESLDLFLKDMPDTSQEGLAQYLIKRGLFTEEKILNLLAEKLKISYINLNMISIDKAVIEKVPVKVASYYGFMPVELKNRVLTIAVPYPLDIKIQDEITTQLGCGIDIVFSRQNDIVENLKKYYGVATEMLEKMSAQPSSATSLNQEAPAEKVEDIEKLAEGASVRKLVNQIILEAYKKRATDIHIEPYRQGVSLRYRVDGLLFDVNFSSEINNFINAVISRIKIMSNLNIVERRLPQDGRAVVRVQDQMLDLRISTMPTPFGESVVIRILPTQMLFSLEKLGLSKRDMRVFEMLVQKPHGIIFVTGPTGSGKTTTLYTCLSRINTKERKIITIEDPIEYEMPGITQVQVMPEIGLDFARGLRSILRHDPDVIMVGEVRDMETAEIAIRVALTGHLVFSTLHTNDAASGITRLIDIGVEPYLAASSVEAFIAQRLIRLICLDCKCEDNNAPFELKQLIADDLGVNLSEVKIFKGKGCLNCNFTGFFGRAAIYEIVLIDDAIKDLILKKGTANQIKKAALSKGMRSLRQDGWQKVIAGLTTPEEVMKVTSAEENSGKKNEPYSPYSDYLGEPLPVPAMSERRIYSRLTNKVKVRYLVFKTQEELFKKGFTQEQLNVTKNISAGGLLFNATEPIPVGSFLELNIELPADEEPIQCLARIVRIEEAEQYKSYNVAICFLDITGAQRARLDRYVDKNAG